MKNLLGLALATTVSLALATSAEARKVPGNPLGPPTVVNAEYVTGECDGDLLTIDDACVEVTWTNLGSTIKYSVEFRTGFDLVLDDLCADDTYFKTDFGSPPVAKTGVFNCDTNGDLVDDAECITALFPVSGLTTIICLEDTDLDLVCETNGDDATATYDSLEVKVKGLNPPQKGPKAISQSTEFSNTWVVDEDGGCVF